MSAYQAYRFGLDVAVFANKPNEPLVDIAYHHTIGSFEDQKLLSEFLRENQVNTLENEFINSDILSNAVRESGAALHPSPHSFHLIENKRIEKETFQNAGVPVTPFTVVESEADLERVGSELGWPLVLKSSKGGYDGYGNEKAESVEESIQGFRKLGGDKGHEIIAEGFIPFRMELAVQVVRNEHGVAVYPCCQTIQVNHICKEVIAPAPIDPDLRKKAEDLAISATEAIDGKGIFAFEFFLTENDEILLNESAPRPHNSGHYTIEGATTSQFENHIRAVMGWPLGDCSLRAPAVVMINILGTHDRPAKIEHEESIMATKDAHLHIYGKEASRTGRKMGHVTLLGTDPKETLAKAQSLTQNIKI